MAYCGPRGIPLHEFTAWPEESQAAALHWQEYEASRCTTCGTFDDDWIDASGEPQEPQHWHGRVCPGCQRLQAAQESMNAEQGERGLHVAAADGPAASCVLCRANT
jgi:hypothetical protein